VSESEESAFFTREFKGGSELEQLPGGKSDSDDHKGEGERDEEPGKGRERGHGG
jgi:hypothetical protein